MLVASHITNYLKMAYHLHSSCNRSLGEWSKARHCEKLAGEIVLGGPGSNPSGGDLICGGTLC